MILKKNVSIQVLRKEAVAFRAFCRKHDLKIYATAAAAFTWFMRQYNERRNYE